MGFRPEEKGIKTPVRHTGAPGTRGWDSDLKKKGLRHPVVSPLSQPGTMGFRPEEKGIKTKTLFLNCLDGEMGFRPEEKGIKTES